MDDDQRLEDLYTRADAFIAAPHLGLTIEEYIPFVNPRGLQGDKHKTFIAAIESLLQQEYIVVDAAIENFLIDPTSFQKLESWFDKLPGVARISCWAYLCRRAQTSIDCIRAAHSSWYVSVLKLFYPNWPSLEGRLTP